MFGPSRHFNLWGEGDDLPTPAETSEEAEYCRCPIRVALNRDIVEEQRVRLAFERHVISHRDIEKLIDLRQRLEAALPGSVFWTTTSEKAMQHATAGTWHETSYSCRVVAEQFEAEGTDSFDLTYEVTKCRLR